MARPKRYATAAERAKAWREKRANDRPNVTPISSPNDRAANDTVGKVASANVSGRTIPSNHAAPSPSLGFVLSHVTIRACLYCGKPTHDGDNFCNDACYRAHNRGKVGGPFAPTASVPIAGRRGVLRARLDALTAEYGEAMRHLDTQEGQDVCERVMREREPVFRELAPLERGLPLEERYFMPVRFLEAP